MRRRTTDLHAQAERSGVVAAVLQGRVSKLCYALYLRNLLPAYQAMEQALQRNRNRPGFRELAQRALYREASIVSDLAALAGPDWATALPLLSSGEEYAARVEFAAAHGMLIAHCYTRSLVDLNGGQILRRRLTQTFGPTFQAHAFTTFPDIPDPRGFSQAYRVSLDRAGADLPDWGPIIEESAIAFTMNIHLSVDVEGFQPPERDHVEPQCVRFEPSVDVV
jgi:heme oxygenase